MFPRLSISIINATKLAAALCLYKRLAQSAELALRLVKSAAVLQQQRLYSSVCWKLEHTSIEDNPMTQMTNKTLKLENRRFFRTAGVSRRNRGVGFLPGFLDQETGTIYFSCTSDGNLAAVHLMDGLPENLIVARSASGRVAAVKGSIIAGFIKEGHFYTREQVARALE